MGMEAVELAHSLRRRLVERARDGNAGPGGVAAQAARLVEHEATALDAETREVLTARIVRLAAGLGPLEPLLADPSVDEVMVNGPSALEGILEREANLNSSGSSDASHWSVCSTIRSRYANCLWKPVGRTLIHTKKSVFVRWELSASRSSRCRSGSSG
jgi:hypothetical protein